MVPAIETLLCIWKLEIWIKNRMTMDDPILYNIKEYNWYAEVPEFSL
jgi:hypothetical protein